MKLRRFAFLAFVIAALPLAARADLDRRMGPPDGIAATATTLAAVMALNARAEGKQLDTFSSRIETWSHNSYGRDSTSTTMWSGSDYKTIDHFGPFQELEGRVAGVRWRQNINGIVVIMGGVHQEDDIAEQAMKLARSGSPPASVTLLGEVASPVAAYVIQITTGPDTATWMFIDKSSGRDVREESVWDAVRTTTTYSDFENFNGAIVAQTVRSTNGQPGESVDRLTSLRLNVPISARDLNLPASRRDLVQFPADATSVKLPVSMPLSSDTRILSDRYGETIAGTGKSHIIVRVTINGRGLDLALDSGASGIIIDREVVAQLGLTGWGATEEDTNGISHAAVVDVPELHVGDLVMKHVAVYPTSFKMRTKETEEVVGLLGFDFIASVGLKVDYDKGEVTAYPSGTMPMPSTAITIPLMLDDLVPDVSVSVGDAASDHFIVDTGSGADVLPVRRGGQYVPIVTGGVTVFPRFAAAHPAEMRDEGLGHEVQIIIPQLYFGVVGGVAEGYPVQLKQVVFGVAFDNFIATVIDPTSHWGGEDLDGLIGYGLLHYFNLYFDYPNSRIVLQPNEEFRNAKHTTETQATH
ncbi:MAG: aspartyl protease family protein [Candidatus Eremiobacteraeota bacterium]|nr:aspartyl protease family protein [Candidatus Eremiobacteraeota bacterium]